MEEVLGPYALPPHSPPTRVPLTAVRTLRRLTSLPVVEAIPEETEGIGYLHASDPAIQWTGKGDMPYDPKLDLRKPTYQRLSDYGTLFTLGQPQSHVEADGGLTETVVALKAIASQYRYQTELLARHLKTGNAEQDAYHVWYWLKTNINYRLDQAGREQIRTPNRSWFDRVHGIDCEDFAVFAHTILSNMGYAPRFEIVAFYNQSAFGHIFVTVGPWVVDDVMGQFNERPKNITNTMIIERLSGLSGLEGQKPKTLALCGLGANAAPDATTRRLMARQSALIAETLSGLAGPGHAKELRKLRYAILLNGTPERGMVTALMPYVDDINHAGNLVYKPGTDLGALEALMDGLEGQELDGLGKKGNAQRQAKKTANKAARGPQRVEKKTAKVAKKAERKAAGKGIVRKVGKVAKKTGKALVKYNPVTIVIRNAFLLSMRTNIPRLASRLKYSYLTPGQAEAKRLDRVEYGKLVRQRGKIEKLFTAIGGSGEAMKSAILKGGKGLSGQVNYLDTFPPSNLDLAGLGVAPAAGVAAAVPLLTAAAKLLSVVDFKTLFAKSDIRDEDESVAEFADDQVAAETTVRPQSQAVNSLIDSLPRGGDSQAGPADEALAEGDSIADYAPLREEVLEAEGSQEPEESEPEFSQPQDPEATQVEAEESELGSLVSTLTSLAEGVKAARASGTTKNLQPVLNRRPERNAKKKKLGEKIRTAVAKVRATAKPKAKVTAKNKGYQSSFEETALRPTTKQSLVADTPPAKENQNDNTPLLVGGGLLLLLALAGKSKKK